MGDTITRVDDGSGQSLLADFARGPGSSQGENSLDSNVQSLNVERLEHNLGSVFTVLGRVQWGLGLCYRKKGSNYRISFLLSIVVHDGGFPRTKIVVPAE